MFMQIVMWSFVPGVATSILQKMYYRVRYGGKKHSPPAGSPLFSKHYRFFYAAVIGTYLVYSLTSSYHNMPESLYDQLGASPTSSVAELKRSFRTMSLRYHPDKTDGNPELEKQFIIIRRAYDMLKDGRSRTYYDRMGSSMLSCQNCITERDFVTNGAMMALIFYLATGLALLLMTFVRRTTGQYWRWSVMLMVASVEIGVLTGSIADPMPGLLASRAPFEKIGFLHDVSFCIAILISQLHGVLFPSTERELAEV
ncbi:DnaJ-domain-containing protein, partial [Caulochytrium protostelioides]